MNKPLLLWFALIWAIFVAWLLIVLPFPINIGLLAWQCFFALVISWLMLIEDMGQK